MRKLLTKLFVPLLADRLEDRMEEGGRENGATCTGGGVNLHCRQCRANQCVKTLGGPKVPVTPLDRQPAIKPEQKCCDEFNHV